MEITVKLVSQIDSATKPLACDRFDPGGKTLPHCSVCDGKGGMQRMPFRIFSALRSIPHLWR
jgi:hypothetical protein